MFSNNDYDIDNKTIEDEKYNKKRKKKNNSKWIAFTSLFIIIGLILMGAF